MVFHSISYHLSDLSVSHSQKVTQKVAEPKVEVAPSKPKVYDEIEQMHLPPDEEGTQ